jgi:hypothetical protein
MQPPFFNRVAFLPEKPFFGLAYAHEFTAQIARNLESLKGSNHRTIKALIGSVGSDRSHVSACSERRSLKHNDATTQNGGHSSNVSLVDHAGP